jgi:hypothetical protein
MGYALFLVIAFVLLGVERIVAWRRSEREQRRVAHR